MTTNNKILTVSYGTFSCTLEGFDDNFGTMKAIAEYFRDLAGDDRYFGAEPPQPDVEMLTRIAEREISRRVEARQHDGKLVLSAEDTESEDEGTAQRADTETVPETSQSHQQTLAEDASEPVPDISRQPESVSQADDGGAIAPKVDKVPEAAEVDSQAAMPEPEAPKYRIETEENVSETADVEEIESASDDTQYSPSEAEAFFAQPSAETLPEKPEMAAPAETVGSAALSEPDSIAAKLQRIRAVVTQSQQETENTLVFEDEYTEDFVAGAPQRAEASAKVDSETATAGDVSTAAEEAAHAIEALQDAEDVAREEADSDVESDDIAAILARFDAETESTSILSEEHEEKIEKPCADEGGVLLLDQPVHSAQDDSLETDIGKADPRDTPVEADREDIIAGPVENTAAESDAPQATAPRARILKVKKAEIDAAIATGTLQEVEDIIDDDSAEPVSETEMNTAPPPAENDEILEASGIADHDGTEVSNDAAVQPSLEDDDVSRLMAEADTQMEEPEGTSRRSAFAHLKAAVKAKKADTAIGTDDRNKDDAYRSDLASVVKPKRPEKDGSANRSESKRPAPLKLVAEQRVDVDVAATGPVRPRRVATREEPAAPETGTNFEEYASAMGAHDLPELLEAAASYLSFVEGREQFSRPQLMTKVRQIERDEFSREDGLRSFGQLLRAGKIEKIKGGRFAVTGDIGYQPDQRAAG